MFLEFYLFLLQCHILDLYFSSSVEDSWIRLQIKHIIKPFREGFFFKVTFGLYLKLQSHWEKCIYILIVTFHSVQSLSHVQLCDPWTVAHQASLSSPTPGVYSNSCLLSLWCYPTITCSVIPFSSCLQSFSASGTFQMSHFFTSGGESIGASASSSVLPMNIQDWFPLGWTGWISLQSKGRSRVCSNTTVAQLCPTLCTPMDFSPPGSSIHGIL